MQSSKPGKWDTFQILALTAAGHADPAIAIAASRAGAVGLLNLDLGAAPEAALEALARLRRHGRGVWGIQLASADEALGAHLREIAGEALSAVALSGPAGAALQRQVAAWRSKGIRTLVEVIRFEEARAAIEAGADGLIAKGAEAGGRVGEETCFILLQRLLGAFRIDVFARGGIGLRTVAACRAAGAAGVVLDSQLALARESPLPREAKELIASMDGSETSVVEGPAGERARLFSRPRLRGLEAFQTMAAELRLSPLPEDEARRRWTAALSQRIGWDSPEEQLMPLGQDAALAAGLSKRFVTVGGIVEALRQEARENCAAAADLRPLAENSPLARSHGTRYPIVQGPMTRVSDRAAFAAAVAEAGALPMLALALMRGAEARSLLAQTREALGGRPWGVGILGFVPMELRQEQIEALREIPPPFALLAGGRPEQAQALESQGIPTYVHAPSPGILRLLFQAGVRRFVFEGRECGGHVGPRSSFVLWGQAIEELLSLLGSRDKEAERCHLLFAGGIHDGRSAAMVEALAAPLAQKGARIGALIGTAYLFTREAVETGAIVEGFQREALACARTVLLESGLGHATRCAPTPFAEAFQAEKQRLLAQGSSAEDMRLALERMNLGRLRIAAKGLERDPLFDSEPQAPRLLSLAPEEQRLQGLYMMGQAAALRHQVCSMEDIHREVAEGGACLAALKPIPSAAHAPARKDGSDVAIIGMSCILPKAPDLRTYWENIRNKVCALQETPKERWDWKLYYDPNPRAKDRINSKWGGFLDDVYFDPMLYGMPPNAVASTEPLQLLTLEAVRHALADAGYSERPFPRERTSVILGAGGMADLGAQYGVRAALPQLFKAAPEDPIFSQGALKEICESLPQWTEDTFPGLLVNVAAGRVANRFNLGGMNFTVDAACASSLAAVEVAVSQLQKGASDMAIVGGVDTIMSPFAYLCFSKTMAFSPSGKCRPLSAQADGIVISEGFVVAILKRLADAERDGDRIYAVIKGIGGSSDGRNKGLTAPHPAGQIRALQRAYELAGVAPQTIGLVEMHATGTVVGDMAEIETLQRTLANAEPHSCAVGSVKSMIGHTKCAAGLAGLAKAALALHYKVLPPTLGVERPNPKADAPASPVYINTEARPWLRRFRNEPRRAGVSAFGFGGTNFHAVLEEYTEDCAPRDSDGTLPRRPVELFLWRAGSRQSLAEAVKTFRQKAAGGDPNDFEGWAAGLAAAFDRAKDASPARPRFVHGLCLAVVAESPEDLRQKLERAEAFLAAQAGDELADPRGIYVTERPLADQGKVAFLFPGQGSQYVNMLADLAMDFPIVRERLERAGEALRDRLPRFLGHYIYPPSAFTEEQKRAQENELMATHVAQCALGAADLAMALLFERFGVRPDLAAGHSYGELAALCAAGAYDEETLDALSEARGRFMAEAAGGEPGAMVAVEAPLEAAASVAQSIEGLHVANINSPRQTLLAGPSAAVDDAMRRFKELRIRASRVPVACAFHTPIVAPARERLAQFLTQVKMAPPKIPVYSNTTAAPYPQEPQAIAARLADHLVNPVRFQQEIEALYEAGARVFVEVGPKAVLTGLTRQILEGRPFLAVNTDQPGRPGFTQLAHALGQMAAHGVDLKATALFEGRAKGRPPGAKAEPVSPTAWLVNGAGARPLRERLRAKAEGEAKPPVEEKATVHSGASRSAPLAVAPTAVPEAQAPASGAGGASDGDAMAHFQKVMNRFLDLQHEVMSLYLSGRGARSPQTPPRAQQSTAAGAPQSGLTAPSATEQPLREPGAAEESQTAMQAEPTTAQAAPDHAARLLSIVSERTGYPPEMLGLDQDMEADLGIDSIKRIEILGAFQEATAIQGLSEQEMEELTSARTMRAILEWIELHAEALQGAGQSKEADSADHLESAPRPSPQVRSQRFALQAVEAPLNAPAQPIANGRLMLVTDDGRGVGQALAEALREDGVRAVLLGFKGQGLDGAQCSRVLDPTSPEAVERLVRSVREDEGPIGGLIHLRPLASSPDAASMDSAAWEAGLNEEVRALFLLARAIGDDLRQAAKEGGACLLAATAMGGSFGSPQGEPISFFPGQGGVAGMVKTLAQEWPEVRIRCVDCDPRESAAQIAARLAAEVRSDDERVEVGWQAGRRVALEAVESPLAGRQEGLGPIDGSWVILITGGARGIAAATAIALAERYRPRLILVGRTPMPPEEEGPLTAGLESAAEIKAALMSRMKDESRQVKLPEVEQAYHRLLAEREIRRTLKAIRAAGSEVRYCSADVRDEERFGAVIEEAYERCGRLDGVIHGAGIIEDKLIGMKSLESFDRVLDTKVRGALVLARRLRGESLKFLVFFSSVAGRFGNRGQIDYAAANEILNKLAVQLDRQWPGRVVSINWGPWASSGMVSAELEREFSRRGVERIEPAEGVERLDEELRLGAKGEVEILIGGLVRRPISPPEEQQAAGGGEAPPAPLPKPYPLVGTLVRLGSGNGEGVEVMRPLDPRRDLYLQDHIVNGKPVFPMAMALEWMMETAAQAWPGWSVCAVRDLRVLKGIVLDHAPMVVRLTARPGGEPTNGHWRIDVRLDDGAPSGKVYYRSWLELTSTAPAPPKAELLELTSGRDLPMPLEQAYQSFLFHGPRFQRILRVEQIGENGVIGVLGSSLADSCLADAQGAEWLLDPVMLDSGLQLAQIWARLYWDTTALPMGFRSLRLFGPLPKGSVECRARIRPGVVGQLLRGDLSFVDEHGVLRGLWEGVESMCSKKWSG